MMKKLYLVEAGGYLLGIDSTAVIGESDLASLVKGERVDDLDLIFLDTFFRQHQSDRIQSDISVVELRTATAPLFVAVDTIRGEIAVGANFEPLPLLYPQRARSCCPRIMMHGEEPVLVLDIAALLILREELGTDYGLCSLGNLRLEKQARLLETTAADTSGSEDMDTEMQQAPVLSDAQFSEIVIWAMGQYLDGDSVAKPPPLQGASRELSQELARRVVRICGSFQHTAVERLKNQMPEGRP